ncbi:uncharacterized protein FIBRA_00185 [Fibroporia radiculosa]|uniref:Uncharacterized protein n=1 Tax=Fibroporia radiculosa TaxID=599839 RepID=J7SBX0_9APHY|nr:uncharacterized protein FIBRA_00185 [Fibroporia radiculosa]CCL98191.1 predicted protein [Fibroporia radiculosa]
MTYQGSEQLVHDRINLFRLIRRLEKGVAAANWDVDGLPPQLTWIKTQGTLQASGHECLQCLGYASLNSIDRFAYRPSSLREGCSRMSSFTKTIPSTRYDQLRSSLDNVENVVKEVDQRVAPKQSRPPSILHTLPPPILPVSEGQEVIPDVSSTEGADIATVPGDETSNAAQNLLLSPSDGDILSPTGPMNPSSALLPPTFPASPAKTTVAATPAFLQNSAALQEELSAQLAQMATQLKRNAIHFSDSLEKDKALVQETQEKLERNFDVMKKERLRVRDHRSKSWGTTWIVLLSIVVAGVGFVLTFLVIRIT